MKKQNTKFRAIDLIIILLCLGAAGASGTAFWMEYNRTLQKLNEDPIGVIVFKKRVAQRRFIDRLVWDRLKQASPIYNGDTIRTTEQSEAYITFNDEITYLNLDANTLIQIFWDDIEGARIDFSAGHLEVVSGSKGVLIASGSSVIRLNGHANMNKGQEGFGLSVMDGQASFDGIEVARGNILALNSRGEQSTEPMIAMTSFGNSARVLGISGEPSPVNFSWNTSNFKPDTQVIVEVARDRNFRNIVTSRVVGGESSVSIPLDNGNYYWRVYPVNAESRNPVNHLYPSGTLELIPATAITLVTPVRQAEIISPADAAVGFSWSPAEGAVGYLVEISSNANMSSPAVTHRVEGTTLTQTGISAGRWYWRITPVFPSWIKGSVPPSAVSEFSVIQGNPVLAAPVLNFPAQNGTIFTESTGRRLLWTHDPDVSSWLVEVADNSGMANPAVHQTVNRNYYALPENIVQPGKTWYWRVSAVSGAVPVVSSVRNFEIRAGSQPSSGPVVASTSSPPPAVSTPPPVSQSAPQPVSAPPSVPPPQPVATPPPQPVTQQPPQPEPQTTPSPQPVTQPVTTPPPQIITPPVTQPEPLPQVSPDDWLRITPSSTLSGYFPPDGYTVTTGQLENTSQVLFSWEGRASEYRYALYRANGEVVVPPTSVRNASYVLANPGILTEGDYVWQVFERDSRGSYNLPSVSNRLTVTTGQAVIRNLPVKDPGALYGNR